MCSGTFSTTKCLIVNVSGVELAGSHRTTLIDAEVVMGSALSSIVAMGNRNNASSVPASAFIEIRPNDAHRML
jgi:hypothetical protein